jgi:hypothetical protein
MPLVVNQNSHSQQLEARKDARLSFKEGQPIIADCMTAEGKFQASIVDISSAGVFIKTNNPLSRGQEIAMIFTLPKSDKTISATGEIVRTTRFGVGVELKIFFNK